MVLQMRDVSKLLGEGAGQVTALDRVDLSIGRGTFVAVVGPSGSGKSTLLQCAAGLEPASSGSVVLDGQELTRLDESTLTAFRRDRVGFVFQAYNLISSLTVADNVALPMDFARKPVRSGAVPLILEQLGLGDRARSFPAQLSGGEQQRVAIARALLSRPAMIVADEPTGALDSRAARDVLSILRTAVRTHGQTILMVTHDPVAAAVADSVVFFADGRVHSIVRAPTVEMVTAGMLRLSECRDAPWPATAGVQR